MTTPAFTGGVPDAYDTNLVPVLFAPWARLVAQRAAAEQPARVLELAAGTGAGTRALRAALPAAELVATDLSPDMLGRARRGGGTDGVTWQVADAQRLPFADDAFDVAVMLFGIMFVPDRLRAYRELRRVLRPGAPAMVTAWEGEAVTPQLAPLRDALQALLPAGTPEVLHTTAHGHHDPDVYRTELGAAGFGHVEVEHTACVARTSADQLARGYVTGSALTASLAAHAVDAHHAVDVVRSALSARFGDGPFELSTPALLVTAR